MKNNIRIISMIEPERPIEFRTDVKAMNLYLSLSKNAALKKNKSEDEIIIYAEKIYERKKIKEVIIKQETILRKELDSKTNINKEILFV